MMWGKKLIRCNKKNDIKMNFSLGSIEDEKAIIASKSNNIFLKGFLVLEIENYFPSNGFITYN